MPTRRRALLILAALALLALASLVLALMVGSVHVPLGDVFPALFGTADSMASEVVRSLRRFAAEPGADGSWQPAPLLVRLAEEGRSFN